MNQSTAKKTLLIFLAVFSCIGCDQVTKILARHYLASSLPISIMGGTFRLQLIENKGGFLSLGADLPEDLRFWLFSASVGMLLFGMFVFVLFSNKMGPASTAALSLIIGGGLSNVLERLLNQGAVSDFLNIRIWHLSTGIFNLADALISAGASALLIIYAYRKIRLRLLENAP